MCSGYPNSVTRRAVASFHGKMLTAGVGWLILRLCFTLRGQAPAGLSLGTNAWVSGEMNSRMVLTAKYKRYGGRGSVWVL